VQTINIGGMNYPIVQVESTSALDPEATAVQCVAGTGKGMTAFFYREGTRFSAWGETLLQAAETLALKISRYEEDCKTTSVSIGGVDYPVRSRSSLWNQVTQSEAYAPMGTVHWWIKGTDDEGYYKCDIHFAEGADSSYSREGIGKTLTEALEDLVNLCEL
jgi:hypothetical protein